MERAHEPTHPDVVVVGGGLAGLAAAASAARAGATVRLAEARTEEGGRARTTQREGFWFNQGPHALYRTGAGREVLRELGVVPQGRAPNLTRVALAERGRLRSAANPFLTAGAGLSLGRGLLGRHAEQRAEGLSMREWIEALPSERARRLAGAMVRLTTYMDDLDHVDAAAVLAQMRRGLHGVEYLHHGWSTLVDGLRQAALAAGVELHTGARVSEVRPGAEGVTLTVDGGRWRAGAVVLANGGPAAAAGLLGESSPVVRRWADTARPVRAGCLDVALQRLPHPSRTAVIGLDEPTYLIVHSATAELAPRGAALVHVMRYGDDIDDPAELRRSLESQLDRAQPGWRDVLVDARFGRRLVVAHDVPRPGACRPEIAPGDAPGIHVAGDWVTTNGVLADAALDSGRRAGVAAADRALGRGRPDSARATLAGASIAGTP